MLTLKQVVSFFAESKRIQPQHMVREYLQYLILESIFSSKYAEKLKFIGGTAIRILYGGTRFSEDLDFDNAGLSLEEFSDLVKIVARSLKKQGAEVETRVVSRGAFRCYIKFPGLFYSYGLTTNDKQKLSIYIDTTYQDYEGKATSILINKFGVYSEIRTQSIDVILSQKIMATLERPRMKGRDLYDIVFLWSKTKPNFEYLSQKKKITGMSDLLQSLTEIIRGKDLRFLAEDVRAFVPKDQLLTQVESFDKWLGQLAKS